MHCWIAPASGESTAPSTGPRWNEHMGNASEDEHASMVSLALRAPVQPIDRMNSPEALETSANARARIIKLPLLRRLTCRHQKPSHTSQTSSPPAGHLHAGRRPACSWPSTGSKSTSQTSPLRERLRQRPRSGHPRCREGHRSCFSSLRTAPPSHRTPRRRVADRPMRVRGSTRGCPLPRSIHGTPTRRSRWSSRTSGKHPRGGPRRRR